MLGGPDVIIETDEIMFGKRKYNRGKGVNGIWVFGGIERSSNKCLFHVVHDRLKNTLLQSIKCKSIIVYISKIQKRALTRTPSRVRGVPLKIFCMKPTGVVRINSILTLRSTCGER
ncbi:hypothetical protein TNCV_4333011 [Trichonephila clavipes]|nr:hypothetical protein TNCV_4333011 [Trichonephila clavipes]